MFDYMPATLAGTLAGIVVLLLLFGPFTALGPMLAWAAAALVVWLGRAWTYRAFQAARPRGAAAWRSWRRRWNLGTLCSGACWGGSTWLFYGSGDPVLQIALIVVVYTFCVAVVPILATQPRIYLAYGALCFVPMASRIAAGGGLHEWQLAGVLLLIFSLTALLARNYRQALQRALELKQQADELLRQLRAEKRAADEARQAAEVANRAKTQFFAAASHDLRQPLHALGLFAEALRQKSHDDEAIHLVNSINGSVDALEALFSELLDITRIDSGGVAVAPQSFEVGDILRKLRLHFEPTAFEKGLALRLRGARQVVFADPLLVERVLRNLVSNAIRYTHDGSVLVGARRRGDQVLLQVWDTGVGIPAEEQARIFEEFYQVPLRPGDAAPDPGLQRKGLGLGLAIVRRLAALMGAPLSMRSVPGRGTVFSLCLPVGRLAREATLPPHASGPLRLTLEGRLIVVVEDEPAVRAGLEVRRRRRPTCCWWTTASRGATPAWTRCAGCAPSSGGRCRRSW
ncbi:HAMP domain-containing sensor histidine kinase [Piscinibacter sakaiensis]|uniref:sensor histidine kinase n=1 Tax=Piscinibacter sakaiensis TaxID=1547922 RepID=UPI003729CBC8